MSSVLFHTVVATTSSTLFSVGDCLAILGETGIEVPTKDSATTVNYFR